MALVSNKFICFTLAFVNCMAFTPARMTPLSQVYLGILKRTKFMTPATCALDGYFNALLISRSFITVIWFYGEYTSV